MYDLERLADLISRMNQINEEIAALIGRPALQGHIGEYIASRVFNIELEDSASKKGVDGWFLDGSLRGRTVNIKIYGKREGFLDITLSNLADYYLVMTGPRSQPITSKGTVRPIVISNVYLFNMKKLLGELKKRGVKIGEATSVSQKYWDEAEFYPSQTNKELILNVDQRRYLEYFS